ncbi:protein of unknown function [Burkholderia multivorans]
MRMVPPMEHNNRPFYRGMRVAIHFARRHRRFHRAQSQEIKWSSVQLQQQSSEWAPHPAHGHKAA